MPLSGTLTFFSPGTKYLTLWNSGARYQHLAPATSTKRLSKSSSGMLISRFAFHLWKFQRKYELNRVPYIYLYHSTIYTAFLGYLSSHWTKSGSHFCLCIYNHKAEFTLACICSVPLSGCVWQLQHSWKMVKHTLHINLYTFLHTCNVPLPACVWH